ncbi:hypothetical protein [Brevibacillus nitrificans]|uniref:hypothetical protein n=1 Tax=Brevibacillus nitrificans TaxID=651560 RepID=UPI002608AA4E|nr:hypothetical protein [Brevibacillus nitrificans]MED1793382.1 hypothetical protein [Brevibacillus nitrificans]
MLPLQKVQVENKTYGQLAAIVLYLIGALVTWNAVQNQYRQFHEDVWSERSLFTGYMYQIELDKVIDGQKGDLYLFSTPSGQFERMLYDPNEQHMLFRIEREIHSMANEEDEMIFSVIMLSYVWLCWLVLRKYLVNTSILLLPVLASYYFAISIWHDWQSLQDRAEDVTRLISRL